MKILITHHMGINPAIWNLHERELLIDEKGEYQIRNIETQELFPLLFFHFSGFDPFRPKLINRRHPKYNTDVYPSYIPLFESYISDVYENGYKKYSELSYSFNSFQNGENIIALHRRLYRSLENEIHVKDPFETGNVFIKLLHKNGLLTGIKSNAFSTFTETDKSKRGSLGNIIIKSLKFVKFFVGIRYYSSLLSFLSENTRLEKQIFLIKKND